MIGVRKLSPGGYEYLTGAVACGDAGLQAGESLSDYYVRSGYPPGEWIGAGAAVFGIEGTTVTAAQMNALFGEGRHPNADQIQADALAAGASPQDAVAATALGRRFARYGGIDEVRERVIDAYRAHNRAHGHPPGAAIDDTTRAAIRTQVQHNAYTQAHHGQAPAGDAQLHQWLAGQQRQLKNAVSGMELIFAPPKSVSTAWALGDTRTRELIETLHDQATRDALRYFEANAAFTRKGTGGIAQHDIVGITAAMFRHWDSRAGDPHLHTHVVISAKVQALDNTGSTGATGEVAANRAWTSLDGRTVLAGAVTVSEYYDSRLRDLLREHGARWVRRLGRTTDSRHAIWELDGIPHELLEGFSQRALQVEHDRARRIAEFRHRYGYEPTPKDLLELGRQAAYSTRAAKKAPRTLGEHLGRWRAQAATMVLTEVLDQLPHRVLGRAPEAIARTELAALATATRTVVSDRYSHFNRWNIDAEAHRQTAHLRLPPGARDTLIGAITDTIIGAPHTVPLQLDPLLAPPESLLRRDGQSVFVPHNSQRWTTRETLTEEADLVRWGARHDGVRLDPATVRAALRREKTLNPGQRAAVIGFARSGARIQQLIAPAGTGKTTMMRVFADAWRAEGGRVYAFGPSARAAAELGASINATPHTLDQVLTALDRGTAGRFFGFRRGDVLLVDEVAMAGTHTLHRVMRYALACGADIRWSGDDHQLAAVEAGGVVRLFDHHNGSLRLSDVVRFADPEQARASLLLREGDAAGLDYHFAHHRVRSGSRESLRVRAEHAWRADLVGGNQTLLILSSNDDVLMANLQARQMRIDAGHILSRTAHGAEGTTGEGAGSEVRLRDGSHAGVGDWVVTRENNRLNTLFGGKDFVKNGDTWTVTALRPDGSLKVRNRASGAHTVLDPGYVAGHVELAYATTINRAQGMSVHGSAHAVIPQGLSREQFYTMITRAKYSNWLYVETAQHTIDSHQETPPDRSAREVLVGILDRPGFKTSATEELRSRLAQRGSLATLVRQHNHLAQLGTESRVDAALDNHATLLEGAPALPALKQTLITAEALGFDSTTLLAGSIGDRELRTARDPAAVLQWRVSHTIRTTSPPHRTSPTEPALAAWRRAVTAYDPIAAVTTPSWDAVWHTAADACAAGIDIDRVLHKIATSLAGQPRTAGTTPGHAATAALEPDSFDERLRVAITDEYSAGRAWTRHLPWQARPDFTALNPELRPYLADLNTAIAERCANLLATTTQDPPAWTARLGPRPHDPDAALRWDRAITHVAAYRDTFTITTNDPHYPLGARPEGISVRAQAWLAIMHSWNPDTLHTDPHRDPNQHRTAVHPDNQELSNHAQAADSETAIHGTDSRPDSPTSTESARATSDETSHTNIDADIASGLSGADRERLRGYHRDFPTTPASLDGLAALSDRWTRLADQLHDRDREQRTLAAFHRYAPEARALAADPRIQQLLDTAEDAGHRAEVIIAQATNHGRTHDTADATVNGAERVTSLLRWRLENLTTQNLTTQHLATHSRGATTRPGAATNTAADAPLPWLRPINPALDAAYPTHAAELEQIATAIRSRQTHLATAARNQPWTAALGARPTDPLAAQHWDDLIATIAAYRETYHVTTTEPLGPSPHTAGAQQAAWTRLHERWNATVTAAANTATQLRANRHALDQLRAELAPQHGQNDNRRNAIEHQRDDIDTRDHQLVGRLDDELRPELDHDFDTTTDQHRSRTDADYGPSSRYDDDETDQASQHRELGY